MYKMHKRSDKLKEDESAVKKQIEERNEYLKKQRAERRLNKECSKCGTKLVLKYTNKQSKSLKHGRYMERKKGGGYIVKPGRAVPSTSKSAVRRLIYACPRCSV